jgi:energy-coupling factor transporter ATP-binding protein EcfA2
MQNDARITSLRKVDWGSLHANFFVMYTVASLPDVPVTYMGAFRAPETRGFDNALVRSYPNVTNVDMSATINQVQRVLDQVIRAVEFLFGFTLAAGLVVLFAAVTATREERAREFAVMRAVGARASLLRQVQRAELVGVGLLAGFLASIVASVIGWALARYVFEFTWTASPLVPVAGALAGAVLALGAGWWGCATCCAGRWSTRCAARPSNFFLLARAGSAGTGPGMQYIPRPRIHSEEKPLHALGVIPDHQLSLDQRQRPIDSSQITAILGRNDSGKSNLLRALHSLNPTEGLAELSPIKDFPRHRRLEECTGDTPVVFTRWALDDSERAALAAILPRAAGVRHVTASRGYAAVRTAGFEGLAALSLDVSDIKGKVRKIVPAVKAAAEKVAEDAKAIAGAGGRCLRRRDDHEPRLHQVVGRRGEGGTQAVAQGAGRGGAELSDKQEQMLVELEDMSWPSPTTRPRSPGARLGAREAAAFIYVDEYPALPGRQNIAEYLVRKGLGPGDARAAQLREAVQGGGARPAATAGPAGEERPGHAQPARQPRRFGGHDRDPPAVEGPPAQGPLQPGRAASRHAGVRPERRLRGRGEPGRAQPRLPVVLLVLHRVLRGHQGRPGRRRHPAAGRAGLHLHPHSQADLLAHFEKDFGNQIVYITHSPFMVPTHRLDAVRTASLSETARHHGEQHGGGRCAHAVPVDGGAGNEPGGERTGGGEAGACESGGGEGRAREGCACEAGCCGGGEACQAGQGCGGDGCCRGCAARSCRTGCSACCRSAGGREAGACKARGRGEHEAFRSGTCCCCCSGRTGPGTRRRSGFCGA